MCAERTAPAHRQREVGGGGGAVRVGGAAVHPRRHGGAQAHRHVPRGIHRLPLMPLWMPPDPPDLLTH